MTASFPSFPMEPNRTRYNSLLLGVARQLADLKRAVKGLVVVTPELEEISQALLQGKVRCVDSLDELHTITDLLCDQWFTWGFS